MQKNTHIRYPKESAGSRMTTNVPVVFEDHVLAEVHALLRDHAGDYDTINYVYVLDARKRLTGVLSVRDIFTHDSSKKVEDVCRKEPLFFVHPEAHQERAAFVALRHNLKAIPVVDREKVFLGEIAADTILKILHKEMHEDALRRVGIRHPDAMTKNVIDLTLWESFRHRIPWLLFGLIGGVAAANIIGFFEGTLSRNVKVGAFIPLIVYMSSAVGLQMEASIIRDLSVEKSIPFLRYFIRHLLVVSCVGVFLSALLFGGVGLLHADWRMAGAIAVSLFAAVLSSVWISLIIPYVFSRLSYDPADASGPVATIVQDIFSIVIYLCIVSILLI